jgi:hypothetical protein
MPLQPGPFDQVSQDAVAVQPGVWDFTDDAIALAAEVQSNTQGWNPFILDLGDFAADPLDDLTVFDADAVLQGVALSVAWSDIPNVDYALTTYDDANTQLGIALSFAPASAWQDPPAPYEPPGSVLNLTAPTVPINAYAPGTSGIVGDQNQFAPPFVQLWNFTRIGSVNFVEGDTFQIAILGNPGQTVTVGGQFNGAQLIVTVMGVLDANGKLGLQGVMGPDVVGAWHEDWYFDGVLVRSFDFIVSPANT